MYPGTTAALTPDKPAAILLPDPAGGPGGPGSPADGAGAERVLTYGVLEERANRLARAWHEAGVRRGDHVALLTTNDLAAFEVYWAAMRSGVYLTAVNHHLTPPEIAYIVDDCGASVLVVAGELAEAASAVVADTPRVRLRLMFGLPDDVAPPTGHDRYEAVRDAASAEPLPDRPRGADMLYSSGTTGRPKGIKPTLPDAQVEDHEESLITLARRAWGIGPEATYLSPAPIYHAAPLRTAAAVQALGGTVVLMPRFDAEAALAAIERHRVTHAQWVPTMFVRMLKLPEQVRTRYDVSSLQVVLHAAAPCPADVKRAMIDWWGPVLTEYYSSTEGNGLTMIGSADWLAHPGSVGRAVVGRLRICDPEDPDAAELPVGQVGTVYFEREEQPFAYHGDAEKTRAAQHPHHPTWTTTGDLGRVDEEGFLYLADRQAFLIISGGVNIYPQEVEDCLALHPAVDDVAVIGVAHEEMGQAVHAVVCPAPGAEPGPELAAEIIAHVRARIATYKAPRTVEFIDRLPRTPTGKLIKGRLHAGR